MSETAWAGIRVVILGRIEDGSFGAVYPEYCQDDRGRIGTNVTNLWTAMHAEIPSLQERPWHETSQLPATPDALRIVKFCWRSIGKPEHGSFHKYFGHYHLNFDVGAGRREFEKDVNRIFRQNKLAYELTADGRIERLASPVLHQQLAQALFLTSDTELDRMLETARQKFLDPVEATRREALESLWDAWERLKTIYPGADKKTQTTAMLDTVGSASSKFREAVEKEAKELTALGNSLQIRHSETSQERIERLDQVDYLFHRLFALIHMILRSR